MFYSKSIFATVFATLQLLGPASAAAFPLKKCVDWLLPSKDSTRNFKDSIGRPNEEDYQRFLYERTHKPQTNPPIAYYTPDTSDTDLLLAVEYWWYPRNIWHETVSEEYPELISMIKEQQTSLGFKVPSAEELLPMEIALQVYKLQMAEQKRKEQKDREELPSDEDSQNATDSGRKFHHDSGRSASPVQTPVPTPSFDTSTPASYGTDSHSFGG